MPVVANAPQREAVCLVVLDNTSQAEGVENFIDALGVGIGLDI